MTTTAAKIAARFATHLETADSVKAAAWATSQQITAEATAAGWPAETIARIPAVVATVCAELAADCLAAQAA